MKKRILFPYIPAMVNIIERWLSGQSEKGMILLYHHAWLFCFAKSTCNKKEYFIGHGFDAGKQTPDKYFYCRVREKYGRRNSKSPLNKSNGIIFEVDNYKVDQGLSECRLMRDRYYSAWYLKMLIVSSILTAVSIIILFLDRQFLVGAFISGGILLYSIISLIIIKATTKMHKAQTNPK